MSLLDKYRKKVTEPTAEVRAEIEKLRAEEAAIKTPAVTPEQFAKLSEEARVASLFPQDAAGIVKRELGTIAVGVLPPDAPKSAPPKSAQAIPSEVLATMHPAIQEVAKQFVAAGATVEIKGPSVGLSQGNTGGTMVVTERKTILADGTPTGISDGPITTTKKKKDKIPPTVVEKEAISKMLADATSDEKAAIARFAAIAGPVALVDEKPSEFRARVLEALKDEPRDIEITSDGFTLQVDVITAGFVSTDLEPYVAAKCRALEKEFGAVDIRCAPADSALGFGKWKGALAALVRDEPPAPGIYLLNDVRGSEIREVVVEALRPLCTAYVRGR